MDVDSGRILIVDDDLANREALHEVLTHTGFEVFSSESGEKALELLNAESVDLILLDITMPGMDGFEVLKRVRTLQGRSELPIIMVTGREERDHVVRALESGANDYVTKPLDLPILLARLRSQLSLKRAYDHIVALEHNAELQHERLESAHYKLEEAYDRMKGDLHAGAALQQALLPTELPEIPGVHFTWTFRPCSDLAGDHLNVTRLDDNHVAMYMLDVSGHGVRAALLSVTLSRMLAPLPDRPSLVCRRCRSGNSLEPTPPSIVAEELNRRFQLDLETWQYFTLFYGVLNTKTMLLRYVSAGQPGPIHVPHDGQPLNLSKPVFAIGWVPEPNYQERQLQLCPGDRLFIFSDGVDEAMSAEKEPFGDQRVLQALAEQKSLELEKLTAHVLAAAQDYSGKPFVDDVSALAIEIDPHVRLRKRARSSQATESPCQVIASA